ncbi:O-antigen ligase family protein [Devosia riboflavina]
MSTKLLSAGPAGRWDFSGTRSWRRGEKTDEGNARLPAWPATLLIVTLVIPWQISVGPIALSMHRIVLLALAVPCIILWASRKAGVIRAPDLLLFLYCIWCIIALTVVHGIEAIESGGMLFAETFTAYLVGRCYVRSAEDFRATARILFLVVAAMLPFALVETVTGHKVMLDLFGTVLPTLSPVGTELRVGFMRVQGPFDHPILFGVFCGGIVAITHGVLGRNAPIARRWLMTLIVVATASLSWSSGPLLSIAVQLALLTWGFVLGAVGARWRILWAIVLSVYITLEVVSNQPVPQLLTQFAFDPWTAYYRLLIWNYGWGSIIQHPLFGTGFGEWVRPTWMPPSIDMFWMVPGIRHGLPALFLFVAAVVWLVFSIGFNKTHDREVTDYKTAYLIAITSFVLAGCTVHFWNSTYVLFLFLLGSGMWMLDVGTSARPEEGAVGRRHRLDLHRASSPRLEAVRRRG